MGDDGKRAVTKNIWLTPTECAKRTGLTIRALRVYERYGLVKPQRTHNNWRCYGTQEIERLNTITVLKTVGMTLAQIRDLVHANEPPLERVLEIQVKAWRTKKSDAERGLLLAHAALKRVQSQQSLSIDAMCNLIRGLEMSDQLTMVRNYVQDNLTPEETKAVTEFMTQRFDPEKIKARLNEQAVVFKRLRSLMDQGVNPASPEVQKLLVENSQFETSSGVHERMLETIEWNSVIAMKFYSVKWKQLKKLRGRPEAEDDPQIIMTPKLWDFFVKAMRQAPFWEPLAQVIIDVLKLLTENPDPSSVEAQALVQRYREIYRKYSLGDPDVYARLVPYLEGIHDGWPEWKGEDTQPAWLFLSQAVSYTRE